MPARLPKNFAKFEAKFATSALGPAKKCLNVVIEAGKRNITEERIRELIREVDKTKKGLNAIVRDLGSLPAALRKNIKQKIVNDGLHKLKIAKRRLLNGKARLKLTPDLGNRIDVGLDENIALSSMAVNFENNQFASQNNWDTMTGIEFQKIQQSFYSMINEVEGSEKIFASGVIDEDIIFAAHGRAVASKHASQVSKAMHFHNELNRRDMNVFGADIKKAEAFTIPHHYEMDDALLINEAEFARDFMEKNDWKKVENIWDVDSSVMTPEEIMKWRQDYVRIGRQHIITGKLDWDLPGTLKSYNRKKLSPAERLGRSRAFHFKSPEAEIFIRKKYMGMGKGKNLFESVMYKFQRDARSKVLLRELGPDWDETWQVLKANALKRAETKQSTLAENINKAKEGKEKNAAIKAFKKQKKIVADIKDPDGKADQNFNELTGLSNYVTEQNADRAFWGRVIRVFNDITSLGKVLFSQPSDLAFGLAMSRKWGTGSFEFLTDNIGQLIKGQSDKNVKKFLQANLIDIQMTTAGNLARLSSGEGLSGWYGKMRDKFFDLTGFQWWTNNTKTGTAMNLAGELAENQSKAWGNLDSGLKTRMGAYGIGDTEWGMVLQKLKTGAAGDRNFLDANSIRLLSDDQIKAYMKASGRKIPKNALDLAEVIDEVKLDLETKYRSFFYNEVNIAIPTPGARERALLKFGTKPGTWVGEGIRLFTQYKIFSTTIATKHLKMLRHGGPGGRFDVRGTAWMLMNASIFGYTSLFMKDLLKGRTPRRPTGEFGADIKLANDALLQGGGLGIFGDLLFAEYNRYGQGFLETLGGPTAGKVNSAINIAFDTSRGRDTRGRAFRFVLDNTPFLNLHFFRTAVGYLFLNKVMEDIDPGYLDRVNKFLKEEKGQMLMFQSQ